MRIAVLLLLTLSLAACDVGSAPSGGVANYDALKDAQAKCAANGGKLVLKDQGDSQYIDSYACKRN